MKKSTSKYLVFNLVAALLLLTGVVVFAARNETVGRALNLLRPEVKVQISGTLERDGNVVSIEKVEAVKPGEILDWKIVSVNGGNASARNYQVVGQIPKGTTFVAGSAKGDESVVATYSIDGGKTFSAQPMIDEKQPDGSFKKVTAPISMYTQLRFEWAKDLAAQSELNASYRVRVK